MTKKKEETRIERVFRQHPELETLYEFKDGTLCTHIDVANKKKGKFKTINRNG